MRGMFCIKQGITKGDGGDILHVGIVQEIRVNEEEDRHVHILARGQSLLFEAKALDLVEVVAGTVGSDIVGGDPHHIVLGLRFRLVKCQGGFPRHHVNVPQLRLEGPGKRIRGVAFKGDADAARGRGRDKSVG